MSSFRQCKMPQPARAYPAHWVDRTAHNRNWQTTGGAFRDYERFCLFKTPWVCFCHLSVSSSDTVTWHVHGPRQTLKTNSNFFFILSAREGPNLNISWWGQMSFLWPVYINLTWHNTFFRLSLKQTKNCRVLSHKWPVKKRKKKNAKIFVTSHPWQSP